VGNRWCGLFAHSHHERRTQIEPERGDPALRCHSVLCLAGGPGVSKSGKSIGVLRRLTRPAVTILALAACASILLVANLRFVESNPGGNDFLARWVGTRALLVERESPYRDSVARQTQTLAYGRAALPGEDEMRFAYPMYSAILFAPFALIRDYALARAVWTTVLELALAGLALIAVRLARWQQSLTLAAVYLLFAVTWYHGVRPLVNGNPIVIVALLVGLGPCEPAATQRPVYCLPWQRSSRRSSSWWSYSSGYGSSPDGAGGWHRASSLRLRRWWELRSSSFPRGLWSSYARSFAIPPTIHPVRLAPRSKRCSPELALTRGES
jgi:hypothetical protein